MAASRTSEEQPQHVLIKWNLLNKIKSTVDVLLESQNANVWSTYGGLSRIIDDLEGILRHGLKLCQDFFGELKDYDVVLKDSGLCGRNTAGKIWLEQALLQHSISNHVKELVDNLLLMKTYYYDYAFLRSDVHFQALCTCLKAVESNNPILLTQLNGLLVKKGDSIERMSEKEISYQTRTVLREEKIPEYVDNRQIAADSGDIIDENETHCSDYSEYEKDDKVSCDVDTYEEDTDNLRTSLKADNIGIIALERDALSPQTEFLDNHQKILAREKVRLKKLKLVEPKKSRRSIDQGTLAQVALSVVMENDERSSSPSDWFDGVTLSSNRRSSSLNEVFISKDFESEKYLKDDSNAIENRGSTENENRNVEFVSDYRSKKVIGHTRSKSDGNDLLKTTKRQLSLKEIKGVREPIDFVPESQSARLSTSLPEYPGNFYHDDPLSPTEEEQSFAMKLASQDLTSCELDKENAHFSISEALIQAIEQMKCDKIIASEEEDEEDEDDEEIQHLKLKIERRRLEKKREKQRIQPAFSDEKSTSNHSSDQSTRSSSSKSSILDTDDISPDWEEITYLDDVAAFVGLSGSETTLVPEDQEAVEHKTNSSIESSTSPPLSAEAVAKSLLKKFANKKHPAASELQWLVSENDVPQALLPLPRAYPVAPDDVVREQQDDTTSIDRRSSPHCRIRGNLEWAPPRPQIIFHVPPAPKRKLLMDEQNYRCTGCGMQVDPGYMKRFRYCHYLGKYFCSSCHHNALMVIPARVIRKWDFKKYEVSKFSMELLNKIYTEPLFNIRDLNPTLYSRVNQLETIKNLRKQLYYMRTFAQTCRKSQELQQEFSKIPDHLLSEEHLYSLQDLLQVKSGEMLIYFKNLVTQSLLHIEDCPLCQAKGFVCEYCRNDDIFFPFQLNKSHQCSNCRASFHIDCYVKDKCPKCERIRMRKSMVAAPIPTDEE